VRVTDPVTGYLMNFLRLQARLCLEPSVSKSGILNGYTLLIQHRVDAKDCVVARMFYPPRIRNQRPLSNLASTVEVTHPMFQLS